MGFNQRKYVGKTLLNVITQRARDAAGRELYFSQLNEYNEEGFEELST